MGHNLVVFILNLNRIHRVIPVFDPPARFDLLCAETVAAGRQHSDTWNRHVREKSAVCFSEMCSGLPVDTVELSV